MALLFFDHAKEGVEPSLAIPTTSVMRRLREEQMKMALERTEEVKVSLLGKLDWRESGQESSENCRRHCGYQGRNREGAR